MNRNVRLFFATDIHASTRCFKKFLNSAAHYDASVIVMGGDISGKSLIPIRKNGPNRYEYFDAGRTMLVESEDLVLAFQERMEDAGTYTLVCDPDEYDEISTNAIYRQSVFTKLISQRMESWVELADKRLSSSKVRAYFNAGNDDESYIDDIIDSSKTLIRPENQCIDIGAGCTMISAGVANLTPFDCPRDVPEEEISRIINAQAKLVPDMKSCIFNVHCPPFKSQLDNAPKLDKQLKPKMGAFGIDYNPVGSTAVRRLIKAYQPLLGLHGHIHESRGISRIGKTVCINPGSEYHEGTLRGALIELSNRKLISYSLTSG